MVQLCAIALHSFLLGILLLLSIPEGMDGIGSYRPARELRLAALHDSSDATTLNRGVKRDYQSLTGFPALAGFRRAQLQLAARLNDHPSEELSRQPTLGMLSIRSPPWSSPL